MSGGFFRGTSADQDTRFSNKQAKLLKSQKFASELDCLVDMTKVKIDVIKPWIANRATELLGFEDEVLINFIYGLLDGKEVDGKQIQIQLTGFMEKNTGKFMKELWSLLLSAQKNVSGIPQQFLDAKEEETRRKKAEADRISLEIQKKGEKERREFEQERHKKLDIKDDFDAAADCVPTKSSSFHIEEGREAGLRNDFRVKGRHSESPHSANHSPPRRSPSEDKSDSKSFSDSRSYSEERRISRSMSRSPPPRRQSISPESHYHSMQKRSISPHLKHSEWRSRSPSRQKSPHSRQRSKSFSQHRSPSLTHCRSPHIRRGSPSPHHRSPSLQRQSPKRAGRRRSPSFRRRSPRWRSPSPLQHRSPSPVRRKRSLSPHHSPSSYRRRRRSPSPYCSPSPVRRRRRRSPIPHHSPSLRRKSPSPHLSPSPFRRRRRWSPSPRRSSSPLRRRRSPSPLQRSPSPLRRRRSPSPVSLPQSPRLQRRSSVKSPKTLELESRISPRRTNRSRSPYRSHSPSYRRRSTSIERWSHANGGQSRKYCNELPFPRSRERSPLRRAHESEVKYPVSRHKALGSPLHRSQTSLRSPQRDPRVKHDVRQKSPVSSLSPTNSPSHSGSPSEIHRFSSPLFLEERARKHPTHRGTPETSGDEGPSHARDAGPYHADSLRNKRRSPLVDIRKKVPENGLALKEDSFNMSAASQSAGARKIPDQTELKKIGKSDSTLRRMDFHERRTKLAPTVSEDIEYGPGVVDEKILTQDDNIDEHPSTKKVAVHSPQDEVFMNEPRQKRAYSTEKYGFDEKNHSLSIDGCSEHRRKTYDAQKLTRKTERNKHAIDDFDCNGNESQRTQHTDMRKSTKLEDWDASLGDDVAYDSQKERREIKRRRKEEKKLRKEERRRRREERHRRRDERRTSRLTAKMVDTVTPPSDFERKHDDANDFDNDGDARRDSNSSDAEEALSEQKQLEIELRKKALESLRAKKAISR